MPTLHLLSCLSVCLVVGNYCEAAESATPANQQQEKEYPVALDFTMQTLGGEEVHLGEEYQGKVVLLVNVASKCGYTRQYAGLQALNEKYGEEGLAVVGVPCNQFGGQEPGSASDIAEFCEATYGVKFDMLGKVNVKRSEPDQCALYEYLTDEEKLPELFADEGPNDIKWNFEKFLINREGEVVGHYRSKVAPQSAELVGDIEAALAEESAE